ncbi:glycine zipper domain-containing protein [Gimesia sp.]|uniref:glycine zipper domain-containing protein n=1 Tax=Gimesia sp. TaxID=2024833 RepID=UPI003A919A6B
MNCLSHKSGITLLVLGLISQVGCASMNHTEAGAAHGAGIGAVTGAIIGNHSGNAGAGALIGAATGGLAGSLIGNAEDAREERDMAIAQANHERVARAAIHNHDVLQMAHSGVSDSVIMGAIRSRGGAFDLSPQSIIALKQQGLSDPLIEFMQQHNYVSSAEPVIVRQTPTVVSSPSVVFVRPRPRPRFYRPHYGVHGHFHF